MKRYNTNSTNPNDKWYLKESNDGFLVEYKDVEKMINVIKKINDQVDRDCLYCSDIKICKSDSLCFLAEIRNIIKTYDQHQKAS